MSPEERNDYNQIMRRKAVDKLYRITNDEPLELDELEELCMLIVRADPDDSNKFPLWVAEVGKSIKTGTVRHTKGFRCVGTHQSNVRVLR